MHGVPDCCWNSTAIGLIPLLSFLGGCCRRWGLHVAVSGLLGSGAAQYEKVNLNQEGQWPSGGCEWAPMPIATTGVMAGYRDWSLLWVYAYCGPCWGQTEAFVVIPGWLLPVLGTVHDCQLTVMVGFQGAELWQQTWFPLALAVTGGLGVVGDFMGSMTGYWTGHYNRFIAYCDQI